MTIPDAAVLRLLPRISCFQCESDPDPCAACAEAMYVDLAQSEMNAPALADLGREESLDRARGEAIERKAFEEARGELMDGLDRPRRPILRPRYA